MRREKSKSPLVLMEQVIMISVFALATAVCVRAFVMADVSSRELYDRDRAVALCQTAAENLKAQKDDFTESVRIYYNEAWELAANTDEKKYVLQITEKEPGVCVANFEVNVKTVKDGKQLFSLPVSRQEVADE